MSDELLPIRCVTCNKILGNKHSKYTEMIENGISIEQALNNLGLNRYCCRLRVRNPFKVVERSIDSDFEKLTLDPNDKANTTGALASMNSSFIVIPEEEEISLPSVKKLVIPAVNTEKKPERIYKAW
jgi:DNA-directed RNA polymerase subunit N (RpoN/RPB10)